MDDPWGISGLQFLALYAVAVGVTVAVWCARRWRADRRYATVAGAASRYGIYEAAYLAAGGQRTALTALVRLMDSGLVRVDERGHAFAASTAEPGRYLSFAEREEPRELHAVEQEVFDAVRKNPGGNAGKSLEGVEGLPEVVGIKDSLESDGMLLSDDELRQVNKPLWLLAVILVIGVTRLINGLALDRPVGFLIAMLIGTVVLFPVLRNVTRLTERGRAARADLVNHPPEAAGTLGGAATTTLGLAVGSVAVVGLAALDEDIRKALAAGGAGGGGGDGGGGGGCGGGCGG